MNIKSKHLRIINITPIVPERIEPLAEDLRRLRRECGVTDAALMMPLGAANLNYEHDTARAAEYAAYYRRFKDMLSGSGLRLGILVQSTLGHGTINRSAFTRGANERGEPTQSCCPLAPGLDAYLTQAIATVAAERPEFMLIDDDFRLANFGSSGCYCTLHLKALELAAGRRYEREELIQALPRDEGLRKLWNKVRLDSLMVLAEKIRMAIDSVDPKIPCGLCMCDACGSELSFARPIARTLAGENEPFLRIANSWYYTCDSKSLTARIYWTAAQMRELQGVDEILAESDTYPHNRYYTPAKTLRAQIIYSILHGCTGLKLWISRLYDYQAKSGEAYRQMLQQEQNYFTALRELRTDVVWSGPVTPLPTDFFQAGGCSYAVRKNNWAAAILAHLGIPTVVNAAEGAAVRMLGGLECDLFTDAEIRRFLSGGLLLDGPAAVKLCERGFGELLGVTADLPENWYYQHERIHCAPINGKSGAAKILITALVCDGAVRLRPQPATQTLSTLLWGAHFGCVDESAIGAGTTIYENELGGRVAIFAAAIGDTAFKDEARREQLIGVLGWLNRCPLPVVVESDLDVYALYGQRGDEEILVAFNLNLDALEKVRLRIGGVLPRMVKILRKDGLWHEVAFETEDEGTIVLPVSLDSVEVMALRIVR